METPTEFMEYWANLGDNRVGPIMRELVEALSDCDDTDKLRRIASRLKFLSSSVYSHANRVDKARRGY
jgi:hypothetical protein